MRDKKKARIWIKEEGAETGRNRRRKNHNQNVLYEKKLFSVRENSLI